MTPSIVVGLNAVIVAVTDEEPRLLTVERSRSRDGRRLCARAGAAVRSARRGRPPHARARPARLGARADGPRAGLRRAALHVRRPAPRPARAGRRAAHGVDRVPGAGARGARRRRGAGALARLLRVPALGGRAARAGPPSSRRSSCPPSSAGSAQARDAEDRRARRERADITFGLRGAALDPVRVLERYELLYEAGLVAESWRDREQAPGQLPARGRRADGPRPPAAPRHGARRACGAS